MWETKFHWTGGWVGPSASIDYMEKWKFLRPSEIWLRPLDRPARSQALYWLRYPDSDIRTKLQGKLWFCTFKSLDFYGRTGLVARIG
jgi:hypothetical protein